MQKTNEQLVELIKSGINEADNMLELWRQNIGFIRKIASKYKAYEDFEDLVQQGYIGLCDAVRGYRPDENVPFINYAAFWIKQNMIRYIENSGSVVRVPVSSRQMYRKYKKFLHDFETQIGRSPSDKEICWYMEISPKKLEDIKYVSRMEQVGSLDSYIDEDDSMTIGDLVADNINVEETVLDEIEKEELHRVLWSVVDTLPGNQSKVIRCIYQEGKTLEATREAAGGVTVERVRIIRQRAISELRKPSRRNKLAVFLPEAMGSMTYRHNGVREFNRTWTSSTELAALEIYKEITGNVIH